jgi:hypothetical protein
MTWVEILGFVTGAASVFSAFTSESYGTVFARYPGCRHVLVDQDRPRGAVFSN